MMPMGRVISFHSYKGGTGKTLMAITLAEIFVMRGKRVCLLDLDFRSPNIGFAYKVESPGFWINDYLNGKCDIKKVLIDLNQKREGEGRLFVGLANPATDAIREMSTKDKKWEMRALGRELSLKETLLENMKLDYLIFDTTSGLQYSSINAVVTSDVVLLVAGIDKVQVEGTRRLVRELYDLFEKKTGILLNKISIGTRSLTEVETFTRAEYTNLYNIPILGIIPCFCEILEAGVTRSFLRDNSDHVFTRILDEVASRVDTFSSSPLVKLEDSEVLRVYKEQFIKKVTGVRT